MNGDGSRVACAGLVSGRVQGVGFRYFARREAQRLGLGGWVRNLPDGRVEFCAEGAEAAIGAFRAWLERGPRGARVDAVEERPAVSKGRFEFEIR